MIKRGKKKQTPFARGLRKMERLARFSAIIDRAMTAASRPLCMCKERCGRRYGRWNKFSRRFARCFWTECPCCLFYRGATVGAAALAVFLAAAAGGYCLASRLF